MTQSIKYLNTPNISAVSGVSKKLNLIFVSKYSDVTYCSNNYLQMNPKPIQYT